MALIEDEAFLPFVKAYAEDEQLFFHDFANAFSRLIAKGCPAHCQPDAIPEPPAASEPAVDKDFRDLAMHGSVERMRELLSRLGTGSDTAETADAATVDVNSTEALSGRTALHKAAYFGHAHVIDFLLDQMGIQVNAQDADGDTALHDAARFGHLAVVEALLSKGGADKTLTNHDGKTPIDLARTADKDAVVAALA
jgi:ankyrin repeat protein